MPLGELPRTVLYAELGLDGRARPVRGVLPAALAAASGGTPHVVVAEPNAAEAHQVPGVEVLGVRSLRQLLAVLRRQPVPDEPPVEPDPVPADAAVAGPAATPESGRLDLADVLGQYEARRALELSAAGGHHLLLRGAPGADLRHTVRA